MAHAPHQESNYNSVNLPYYSVLEFFPPQAADYTETLGATRAHAMAQAMMAEQQYPSQNQTGDQRWQFQQAYTSDAKPSSAAQHLLPPNDMKGMQGGFFADGSVYDTGAALNNGLPASGYGPQSGTQVFPNNGLMYPLAATNLTGRTGPPSGGQVPWTLTNQAGFLYGVDSNMSDIDTTSSYSPKSYNTDNLSEEQLPLTPLPIGGGMPSSSNHWPHGGASSFPAVKEASPEAFHASYLSTHVSEEQSGGAPFKTDDGGLSPEKGDSMHGLPMMHSTHSQMLYPRSGHPAPSTSHSNQLMASLPLRQRPSGMTYLPRSTSNPPAFQTPAPARANFPMHNRFPGTFQRSTDSSTLRKTDDEILLQGKRNGLTYKEISSRLHTKCAESTLRGRYRALTKARKDRVRKPIWTDIDIKLLKEYVEADLERIDGQFPVLSAEQRLVKVQWKKVADYIEARGGSYHFGNSTCKRKWLELYPDA